MCVCERVCVCVREIERESDEHTKKKRHRRSKR